MAFNEQDPSLPVLRPDIEIFAGPLEDDGSPTYVIHDPLTGIFHKIGWREATVLKRLRKDQTLNSIANELQAQTALNVSPEEVKALCEDAERKGLTVDSQVRPARELHSIAETKKTKPAKWLMHHYLYFRVPLFDSDDFLNRALPWARLLAAKPALFIYSLFACLGLFFLSQHFERYMATFPHFFGTRDGLIAYILTIIVLKIAHEFGHAFVAKHYGLRVPTMGVVFMVFAPVAYSDVTDAWRLRRRKDRLAISLAGIKVELVIGALAMAFWGLTQQGPLNSICFLLSSTTLVSTFIVNLNPAMRFDGYYILSDLWGIDNLSKQSSDFTKWFLRRVLLGLHVPCPLTAPKRKKQVQMVIYSIYAWTYRFFLYLSIAVIVYYKFTKTLGIILLILEIQILILRPILEELKTLIKMRSQMTFNMKMSLTLTVILLTVGWMVWPLPRTREAPAVLLPARSQVVYTPNGGMIKETAAKRGQRIKKGDVLAQLESESLDTEIDYQVISARLLRHNLETLATGGEGTALIPEMAKQLGAIEEELTGLINKRNQLIIRARIPGTMVEWNELLRSGIYVQEHQPLGMIASTDSVRIDAFFSEKEVKYLVIGQDVMFYPSDHSTPIAGIVERIDPIREEFVQYLDIGAAAAEELPTASNSSTDQLTILESYYRVSVMVHRRDFAYAGLGKSGHVRYRTKARSLAWEYLQYCYSVLIHEMSF